MTGTEIATSAQVTASLISGGAALIVALLGIAGAIAAQTIATRRAFQDSLVLLEREGHAHDQERQDQARREDAFRFAEKRQSTYLKYAQISGRLFDARVAVDSAVENWKQPRDLDGGSQTARARMSEESNALRALDKAAATWVRFRLQLDVVEQEVILLAEADVRDTAADLGRVVGCPPDLDGLPISEDLTRYTRDGLSEPLDPTRYIRLLSSFFDAARQEIGIGAGSAATDPPRQSP